MFLSINTIAKYTRRYYKGPLYISFYSFLETNSCVRRDFDSFWYEPDKFKVEVTSKNYDGTPNEKVTFNFLGEEKTIFGSGLSIHETIMNSKSKAKIEPLNIYCPSCEEKKEYVINVNIKAYKQKYTKRIKEAADIEKREKERILNRTLAPMRKQCEELGFKKGTKSFKDCVVELM